MKNLIKLSLVALGFCMAIIATTAKASAVNAGGACVDTDTRKCGTTAGGTTVYGYWQEESL